MKTIFENSKNGISLQGVAGGEVSAVGDAFGSTRRRFVALHLQLVPLPLRRHDSPASLSQHLGRLSLRGAQSEGGG